MSICVHRLFTSIASDAMYKQSTKFLIVSFKLCLSFSGSYIDFTGYIGNHYLDIMWWVGRGEGSD